MDNGTADDVKVEWWQLKPKQLTLTDYLKRYAIPPQHNLVSVEKAKQAVKEWLKEVGLPDYWVEGMATKPNFSATESLRNLLVILVDEP